jgi:hypothetical protein
MLMIESGMQIGSCIGIENGEPHGIRKSSVPSAGRSISDPDSSAQTKGVKRTDETRRIK